MLAKRVKQVGGVPRSGPRRSLLAARPDRHGDRARRWRRAWLLGCAASAVPGFATGRRPTPGAQSRVRSALLEMELDHDTRRAWTGRVLAGPYAGRALDELDEAELAGLAATCRGSDADGLRLLEAYLDRRFPGWREDAQGHGDAGGEGSAAGARSSAMTEQEAYEVLGLRAGREPTTRSAARTAR